MEGMARSHDQAKLDAPARRDAQGVRGGRGTPRRHGRLRGRGDLPHLQDRRGRAALPRGRRARSARSGIEVVPRKSGGGTDGNFFNAKGIPCVAMPRAWSTSTPRASTSRSRTWSRRAGSSSPIVTQEPERRTTTYEVSPSGAAASGSCCVALLSLAACGSTGEQVSLRAVRGLPSGSRTAAGTRSATATADDVRAIADDVRRRARPAPVRVRRTSTTARSRTCARPSPRSVKPRSTCRPTTLDVARPLLQDAWDDVDRRTTQVLVQRLDVACTDARTEEERSDMERNSCSRPSWSSPRS